MSGSNFNTLNTQPKSAGPVIGAVIIILILVIGALYFWGAALNRQERETSAQVLRAADPILSALETQNSSDDIASIKADITATDLSGIDSDLKAANQDLPQ